MKPPRAVIFDLDGTLLDTSPGIFHAIRYTERNMGLTPMPDAVLPYFVGPPLSESYQKYGGLDQIQTKKAIQWHREYYSRTGFLEAKPYPGIRSLLTKLSLQCQLAVATLKRESAAHQVLEAFGLSKFFHKIAGTNDQESVTKSTLLQTVLNEFQIPSSQAVLIGDSIYDANGAAEVEIDFVAVTYGFGFHSADDVPLGVTCCHTVKALEQLLNVPSSF